MQRRLPSVIWRSLIVMWIFTFAMLLFLVQSKAGMGDGLVEGCMRQKILVEWSRPGQIAVRLTAATN